MVTPEQKGIVSTPESASIEIERTNFRDNEKYTTLKECVKVKINNVVVAEVHLYEHSDKQIKSSVSCHKRDSGRITIFTDSDYEPIMDNFDECSKHRAFRTYDF